MVIIVLTPSLFSGKVCRQCGFWYPFTQFGDDRGHSDKRSIMCFACARLPYSGSAKNQAEVLERQLEAARMVVARKATREINHAAHRRGKLQGTFTPREWRDLCQQYGNRCLRCGAKGKLSPDHVVPVSKGGRNTIGNIQPLCWPCNQWKRDKHIDYRVMYKELPDDL